MCAQWVRVLSEGLGAASPVGDLDLESVFGCWFGPVIGCAVFDPDCVFSNGSELLRLPGDRV